MYVNERAQFVEMDLFEHVSHPVTGKIFSED